MKVFKVGATVKRIENFSGELSVGTICDVSHVDKNLIRVVGHESWFCSDNFQLLESKYPNLQHKHADVIIEWAKGANIQQQSDKTGRWYVDNEPRFINLLSYRVEPAASGAEDIKTQAKIDKHQAKIDALKLTLSNGSK
jgi:hypothetical protein